MIWLTWRQFRGTAAITAAALALLAAILLVTGPGLADEYSTGIAACGSDCGDFVKAFFTDHQGEFLAVTAVALVLPALIGLFLGAPLITRELESGTHRLVWTQSVTRTRWLAVKLGLVGAAAVAAAGLGSLGVDWWSGPIDKSAGDDFARMEPLLFAARGIVPIGYAAFAFAVGATVGLLIRRTLPAMAATLAVFLVVQIAMPTLVRPPSSRRRSRRSSSRRRTWKGSARRARTLLSTWRRRRPTPTLGSCRATPSTPPGRPSRPSRCGRAPDRARRPSTGSRDAWPRSSGSATGSR